MATRCGNCSKFHAASIQYLSSRPARSGSLVPSQSVCTLRCKFCAAIEGVAEATLQNEVSEPADDGTALRERSNRITTPVSMAGVARHYDHSVLMNVAGLVDRHQPAHYTVVAEVIAIR